MLELFANNPVVYVSFVFVVSLLVGSFLNVVIYRLPVMMQNEWQNAVNEHLGKSNDITKKFNLAYPRSSCPNCGHQIKAYENIPLVSWSILRGKCSNCHHPISVRYPFVELLTACLSAVVAHQLGFTIVGIGFVVATWLLIAMSFIDFDNMLLPDSLTLSLLWLGLLCAVFSETTNVNDKVLGAIVGYLFLYAVFQSFKIITGKEGLGFGDFKLLGALGAWVGWQYLPLVILLSSVSGAIIGIIIMIVKNKNSDLAIPFGPYLAIAGFITMLFGESISTWYLNLIS